MAVLLVFTRVLIRFMTRRGLALDDYFLFLAFAFLTSLTALVYHQLDSFYLATAIERNPLLYFEMTTKQVDQLLS